MSRPGSINKPNYTLILKFISITFLTISQIGISEENWTVTGVDGGITISRLTGDTPQKGEKVRIYFQIPGLPDKAVRAMATIKAVEKNQFSVVVDTSTQSGEISIGDRVERVITQNPANMSGKSDQTAHSETTPKIQESRMNPASNNLGLPFQDVPLQDLIPKTSTEFKPRTVKEILDTKNDESSFDFGQAIKRILALHNQQFIKKVSVDDSFSQKWFDHHIKKLDAQKYYFIKEDIRRLRKIYGNALDDAAKKGDVSSALVIWEILEKRHAQRANLITQWLWEETFQLDSEDTINKDRQELEPPEDEFELMSLWRNRLQFDLVDRVLKKNEPIDRQAFGKIKLELMKETARAFQDLNNIQYDALIGSFIKGLTETYSSNGNFLTPMELSTAQANNEGTLFGIGAELNVTLQTESTKSGLEVIELSGQPENPNVEKKKKTIHS